MYVSWRSCSAAASSLADHSDQVAFWGESAQDPTAPVTTTDMGSGNFPSAGYGQAAYMRNIVSRGTDNSIANFADNYETVSDTSRYQLETHYDSSTGWGSYIYLGGPGAGGVVGG